MAEEGLTNRCWTSGLDSMTDRCVTHPGHSPDRNGRVVNYLSKEEMGPHQVYGQGSQQLYNSSLKLWGENEFIVGGCTIRICLIRLTYLLTFPLAFPIM